MNAEVSNQETLIKTNKDANLLDSGDIREGGQDSAEVKALILRV